ncbi:SHC-transforming protein 4 [Ambystoma mexicanum]|uniref:SHC-transforming protein 4 n=1 Tax=Ambystoma mexicanum TaxID=8296 RepID=UPI0037E87252
MRDSGLQTLSEPLLDLGSLRPSGMLHRAKYSRFRNDSITSLEDGRPSAPLHVKVTALSPLSRSLPTEDVTLVAQDSSNALCTLIPKMANLKLSNPASLLGLRHFSLGTKEVPRVKLMESQTTPSSPISTEVSFSSYMATSPSQQVMVPPARPLDDILLVGLDEPSSPDTPAKDLLCKSDSLLDNGMTYSVRYLGCIEVLQSMRSLDFSTRTLVTREAISRLCEVVPGTKGTLKKRKPPVRFLNSVLGKSNLQFSGVDIKLTISTRCLALMRMDTPQVIATHHMQCISFASGGDPDTADYVAYVAKDPVNQRACHILECRNGLAQDVINTIGQAFELRFKQYLKNPISLMGSSDSETILLDSSTWNSEDKEDHEYYNEIPGKWPPTGGLQDARRNAECAPQRINCSMPSEKQYGLTGYSKCTNIYENCLEDHTTSGVSAPSLPTATQDDALLKTTCKSDLFDDPCYINTQALPITGCPPKRAACKQTCGSPHQNTEWKESAVQSFPSKGASHSGPPHVRQQVSHEDWFHGKLSRKAAESCLVKDGDFLVRESVSSLSHQYVLSGLQGGQAKHLLLVDPEGKVRTKDHVFDNVGHLIRYHVDNDLPIISSGSELCLKQPVRKNSTIGPKV